MLDCLSGLLAADGVAVFELGAGQGAAVSTMAVQAGFRPAIRRDYGGIERALLLEAEKKVGIGDDAQYL